MFSSKVKWLLLADIHFKHHDLDRIKQTAAWIRSVAEQHQVRRVVVCGDLLTCRSSQPTHVLSACYRFLDSLVRDAHVAHTHILLGNHDLAYRRDYATTALDALRLAEPVVQLHREVDSYVWDGRRVMTLPFREDQSELTDAVATLSDGDAAETVAFAHLAVHRAVTQRHVVRPSSGTSYRNGSVEYQGLTGPGYFSNLARTFTGHFHCNQTILQPLPTLSAREGLEDAGTARLRGSVTYIGSPLQLTWADLWDEQRGVILLDPETLDHELIANPHAVGFITVSAEEILGEAADPAMISGRHVMLLGDLTRFTYTSARDKLIALGARSIRSWSPVAPSFESSIPFRGIGTSAPASDASLQNTEPESCYDTGGSGSNHRATTPSVPDLALAPCPLEPPQVDIREQAAEYVKKLDLDKSLERSRKLLVQVGQRLMEAATMDQSRDDGQTPEGWQPVTLSYKSIISPQATNEAGSGASHMGATAQMDAKSSNVFNAQPRSVTITNFLGIQSKVHLYFGKDIKKGLTFLVGENGSGKSTLVEAIVWCQFGRCLRSGLGADDVVNDKARRDCSVRMEFENGYAITRFRKHRKYRNKIIVERNGTVLPEFEKADAHDTQAAIDELLGADYNSFVRTIVLGHESATGFLSSTPKTRRALILSILGLEILDHCTSTTRRLLSELDDDRGAQQSRVDGLEQRIGHVRGHIHQLLDAKIQLEEELTRIELQRGHTLGGLNATPDLQTNDTENQSIPGRLDEKLSAAQQQVDALIHRTRIASIRISFDEAKSALQDERLAVLRTLAELDCRHSQLLATKPAARVEHIAETEKSTTSIFGWILCFLAGTLRLLQSTTAGLISRSPAAPGQGFTKNSLRGSLKFLRQGLDILRMLTGLVARKPATARREEANAYHICFGDVEAKMAEHRRHLSRLTYLMADRCIIQQISGERAMPECDVRNILNEVSTDDAKTIPTKLNVALEMLASLQDQREVLAAKRAKLGELQAAVQSISAKLETYGQIIENESATLQKLDADREVLQDEINRLAADRGLLEFWESSLAQKTRRVSSPTPSSSTSAKSTVTFRKFVLDRSLAELNTVITHILTMLFEGGPNANPLTTRMLRSLFASDELAAKTAGEEAQYLPANALDTSLSIDANLSYGKRSGGERKRIDLALFFALLYVGHARSPHRTHYMLIDEVFDSLDAAGQAAVLRWCHWMAATRYMYIIVITHSDYLVSQGGCSGEHGHEGGACGTVLTAKMGEDGVELEMDGRRVG